MKLSRILTNNNSLATYGKRLIEDNMPDSPLDNIIDEFVDEGEFEPICDQCGAACALPNDIPLWDDFDQLNEEHDLLQLIYSTSGFHEVSSCSKKCQEERIAELRKSILKDFGPTCSRCPTKIGTERMEPCHTCKKLACKSCGIEIDGEGYWWCSEDCKPKFDGVCLSCLSPVAEGEERCSVCNRWRNWQTHEL